MLTKYQLMMPHAVFSGKDALEKIPEILAENKVRRLAIFADKGIEAAGLLELPMAQVRKSGVDTVILDDLPAEPSLPGGPKAGGPVQGLRCRLHPGRRRRQRHGHRPSWPAS